jgi:NTE family protein
MLQSPYKGLVPYNEEDAPYFFGRGPERRLISAALRGSRLTVLYGESGCGKSSVLAAGVAHDLRDDVDYVLLLIRSWRDDPLAVLKAETRGALSRVQGFRGEFADDDMSGLLRLWSSTTPRSLLIVLDQFEEYFQYHPGDSGPGTLAYELPRLLNAELAANFLLGLREDSLSVLDRFKGLIPNLFDNLLRVEHLSKKSAEDAICKPLEKFNEDIRQGKIAEPPNDLYPIGLPAGIATDVVEEIIAAQGDGQSRVQAPYLQLVMTRWWDREVSEHSQQMRADTLRKLGGVRKVVETYLDDTLEGLSATERAVAAEAFRFMVTPAGRKIAQTLSELRGSISLSDRSEDLETLLRKLQEARLLSSVPPPKGSGTDERAYEFAHDVVAKAALEWQKRFRQAEEVIKANDRLERLAGISGTTITGSPVHDHPNDPVRPLEGAALCLSGSGYRAMLFQLGSLWRLNELRCLKKLDLVSSVSGASITSGVLALNWKNLDFDAQGVAQHFDEQVTQPVRLMASKSIDISSILQGMIGGASSRVADYFNEVLYHDAKLQDLPDDPRFVINATSMQTGLLWRFSKPFMGDWKVGLIRNPDVELATAVAASTAFPPVLSPCVITVEPNSFDQDIPAALGVKLPDFRKQIILTDGAVYDNLGLETAWKKYKTILVSSGSGGALEPEADPKHDWLSQSNRIQNMIYSQVVTLRTRSIVELYNMGVRDGSYWGIGTDIRNYLLPDALVCPFDVTTKLAQTAVRLSALNDRLQEQLIDWGYAVCDAAMRKQMVPNAPPPQQSPYGTFRSS